jgi:hypothetical protein
MYSRSGSLDRYKIDSVRKETKTELLVHLYFLLRNALAPRDHNSCKYQNDRIMHGTRYCCLATKLLRVVAGQLKNSPPFMKPNVSLQCLYDIAIGPYPEPKYLKHKICVVPRIIVDVYE